ncbi:MAG: hypothetical protein AAGB00_01905 [Planctomycetota bacterium]
MIEVEEFTKSTQKAYEAIRLYRDKIGDKVIDASSILAGGQTSAPTKDCVAQARRFVGNVSEAKVVLSRSIRRGFGSWLMVTKHRHTIAINRTQLQRWAAQSLSGKAKNRLERIALRMIARLIPANNCLAEAMEVRCILHELGHISLQPELVEVGDRDPKFGWQRPPTILATPDQERGPCIFAATLLGIFLGEFACEQRREKDIDDSPGRPI